MNADGSLEKEDVDKLIDKVKKSGQNIKFYRVDIFTDHNGRMLLRWITEKATIRGDEFSYYHAERSDKSLQGRVLFNAVDTYKCTIFTNYWCAWAYARRQGLDLKLLVDID